MNSICFSNMNKIKKVEIISDILPIHSRLGLKN